MTTRKKPEPTPTNINNNTNNITVNVPPTMSNTVVSKKPNWVVKAIVVGVIGLVLSLAGWFIKQHFDEQHGNPPQVHNNELVQPNQ